MNDNRRDFLKKFAVSSMAIPFSNPLISLGNNTNKKKHPIYFFSKPLDKFGHDFMIDTLKMAGGLFC